MRHSIVADQKWSPEKNPEVVVTYGQLTPKQFAQQVAVIHSTGGVGWEWVKFVIQHGVRSVTGCEVEEGGSIRPVKVERVGGLYGEIVSDESYEALTPFLSGEMPVIVDRILSISQPQ